MTTAESLFSLRIALVTSILEARVAMASGLDQGSSAGALQRALRAQISQHAAAELPANWLRTRIGLSDTEQDLLWLLVAAETSSSVRALVATATGATQLSISAVTEIIYGDLPSLRAHRELTNGRLRRLELVQRTDGGDDTTPNFQRTVRAHSRIVALCLGDGGLAAELEGTAMLRSRDISSESLVVGDGCLERSRAVLARPDHFVVAVGRRGTGRTSLLASVACEAGQMALIVEGTNLSHQPEKLSTQLRGIARESMLLGAAVLVRNLDALPAETLHIVDTELLGNVKGPCMATTTERLARPRWRRPVAVIELANITGSQRELLWKRAIPTATPSDSQYLASTYPFAPSVIDAVGRALQSVTSDMPTSDQVLSCIDSVVDERVGALADRVVTSQRWNDVVLPEDQLEVVQAIIARVRQRSAVYEGWGFGAKLAKGLAVTALLSGPPGTGKTMLAGLIAKDLGLPLYQVDLSKIVSKWIGETEKHLGALFDAAEAGHAVLLFDEADSLFGKRTEVKSSNDRHANLEVNFLLQRIERFTGICFLTTNHENAVDEAFRRRLAFHLRFSIPDVSERTELWRRMLPSAAPVVKNIDFDLLGQKLSMSGGYIRNAVLSAAFAACDEGSPISMAHLWNAGVAEYEAMGKIASGL